MNFTALQTFVTIVDTGSLIRASQALHVTQSTVTARLKTLEDELGQQLLNRQKSGTTLTPAGTKFLRYARVMTGLWRQAKYETALPEGLASTCTFGCEPELWHGAGQVFFRGMLAARPDMAVSVQRGTVEQLEAWLSEGRVDVILTSSPIARGKQTVHTLPQEELALFSNRPNTPIDSDPHYIFVDFGQTFRREHDEFYHQAGVARIGFDSARWALQHILDQGGSAYLPHSLAAPFVETGELYLSTKAPVFKRKKYLIVNDTVARNWDWFDTQLSQLKSL